MELYKKHDINPLNVGCLPILIQMPIVMALFFALKYPSPGGITKYPDFLWMDLTERSFIMIAIAVLVYAVQAYVSMMVLPEEQQTNSGYLYYSKKVDEEMAPILKEQYKEQAEKERKNQGAKVKPNKKRK